LPIHVVVFRGFDEGHHDLSIAPHELIETIDNLIRRPEPERDPRLLVEVDGGIDLEFLDERREGDLVRHPSPSP
jgi:hypothetical protein